MNSNPFWQYSLSLYQRPGVSEFCLRLQDGLVTSSPSSQTKPLNRQSDNREYININLLLFCCWVGSQRIKLSGQDFASAEGTIKTWHTSQVLPLRAERRAALTTPQRKEELLTLELAAEQVEQNQLFDWFQSHQEHLETLPGGRSRQGESECIQHNLRCYLANNTLLPKNTEINSPFIEALSGNNPLQEQAETLY